MKILFALLAVSFFTVVLSEDTVLPANTTVQDESTVIASSETTVTSTSTISSSTTEVPSSSTTEVSSSTTTEVSSSSTTEVSSSSTTEVSSSTTTEVSSSSTTEVSSSTTAENPSSTTIVAANTTTSGSSTTEKPATTTPSPITSTVDPKPKKCTWNVTAGDVTCIRAEMQAEFIIDIKGNDSYVNLGCSADLLSNDCPSNDTQELILSEKDKYILTMVFKKDSDKFSARNITLQYTLPDGEQHFVYNDSEKLFSVKVGNSYLCNSDVDVHLGNVVMKISEMRIQAFAGKDDTDFGSAEECNADDTVSDIIPIAVGIVLVALVLVVLIAYLIGRRRKSQKGYQTFQE